MTPLETSIADRLSDMDKKMVRVCTFVDEYEDYLALCLKREKVKERLYTAIIEKTFTALLLSGIGFLVLAAYQAFLAWLKVNSK